MTCDHCGTQWLFPSLPTNPGCLLLWCPAVLVVAFTLCVTLTDRAGMLGEAGSLRSEPRYSFGEALCGEWYLFGASFLDRLTQVTCIPGVPDGGNCGGNLSLLPAILMGETLPQSMPMTFPLPLPRYPPWLLRWWLDGLYLCGDGRRKTSQWWKQCGDIVGSLSPGERQPSVMSGEAGHSSHGEARLAFLLVSQAGTCLPPSTIWWATHSVCVMIFPRPTFRQGLEPWPDE